MSASNYLILIGPPNSGKTTLFNWITGYKRQTVNYPGSTVDLSIGLVRKKQSNLSWKIVDTPGVYHLSLSDWNSNKRKIDSNTATSAEEQVVQQILWDASEQGELRGVILVLDATRLSRQLPLLFYLKAAGVPLVLALSMYDLQRKTASMQLSLLSQRLGVPVCPIEGLLGGGVRELLQTAQSYFKKKISIQSLSFNSALWSERGQEKLLKKAQEIVQEISIHKKNSLEENHDIGHKTRTIDTWLLHPVFGFAFLSIILFTFFSSIFWLAQPVMDFIDTSFGWMVHSLTTWGEGNAIINFLANGVLTSFGAFFIFVPQVFILFLGIHLLEDSGYLARAVSLVDGPFSRVGLSGKSLIPFLSGFACAIPAVLSTRMIPSKKEKWITIFVIPLMTCSARLPVYVLLLGFLFYGEAAWKPGLLMAGLYFLSLVLGIAAAGLLNLFFKKDKKSNFLIELPLYRRPIISNVLAISWSRTKHFIWKAGPVICLFALIMWGAVNFPHRPNISPKQQVQQSYAGQFGQWIEPAFEQMGGDWRVGISLLSAFVAREVFVSVLAVVLQNTTQNVETHTDTSMKNTATENIIVRDRTSLVHTMKEARTLDGKPLFSFASIMSLLVFFILSLQCLSTTSIVYRETRSWQLAGLQLVVLNLLAYIGAVFTFYVLS